MSSAEPGARPARVLIVDDHPAVREALGMRISRQPDLEVCGEAEDVPQALKLVASQKPDIAVIDISLKTGNGLDLVKRIKAHDDNVRLLIWSMHSESLYAERALYAGASGYITKSAATEKIVEAIRCVLAGKVYVSEQVEHRLLKTSARGRNPGATSVERLSDRELEAFELFGQGLGTNDIAHKMQISKKTVETYRLRIKEKLNLSSVNELVQHSTQWLLERAQGTRD